MNRLHRGGTIEVGKMADFILVDRNPLTAPLGTVHDMKVLRTYIEGELVYSAPFPPITKPLHFKIDTAKPGAKIRT